METLARTVLDLFSGMGGLSWGFVENGFNVTGIDVSDRKGLVYRKFTSAKFRSNDISKVIIHGNWEVLIGGPPCRPWSSVNQSRRKEEHRDYSLVGRYVSYVKYLTPEVFILENVPSLGSDQGFQHYIDDVVDIGYSVKKTMIKYSEFGAATSRKRLFVVGLRNGSAEKFVDDLKMDKRPEKNLKDVIGDFRSLHRGEVIDHEWPNLNTISKYASKYETEKYGWRILDWNSPAPSFGNVMKTYVLPPDSNPYDPKVRVLSVLEVSRIMGFNHGFTFPDGFHLGEKYQMLVDSVSPVFSEVLAKHVYDYLERVKR